MNQELRLDTLIRTKVFTFEVSSDTVPILYIENKEREFQNDSSYLYTESIQKDGIFIQRKFEQRIDRFFVEKGRTEIQAVNRSNKIVPIWINLSVLFWILVVVFARQSYSIRLRQIFTAVFNPKNAKQLQQEGSLLFQGFPALLIILNAFTLAFFAFKTYNDFYPDSLYFSIFEGFLILFAAIIIFQIGKILTISFISILFDTRKISSRYMLDQYMFYITNGLILFPLLLLFQFSNFKIFLFIALFIHLSLWLYRLIRAFIIGLECTNYSWYYLIVYLCTLEVLPFFLLYKLSLQFV